MFKTKKKILEEQNELLKQQIEILRNQNKLLEQNLNKSKCDTLPFKMIIILFWITSIIFLNIAIFKKLSQLLNNGISLVIVSILLIFEIIGLISMIKELKKYDSNTTIAYCSAIICLISLILK